MFCISSALAQASLTVSATAVRNAIVETAIAPAGPVNSAANGQVTQPKAPEPATIKINRQAAAHLPPADGLEEADAQRGFLATLPDSAIQAAQVGSYANALGEYGFLDQVQAPDHGKSRVVASCTR
ncbi:MAG TPA: hypothetical protein VGF01_02410 [Terracidiphilus sp.]